MITPETIENIITNTLDDVEYVQVESQDNVHFYVVVVGISFDGKTKIAQHKMVKDLFVSYFADESIHAMSLKTYTPEKWKLRNDNMYQ